MKSRLVVIAVMVAAFVAVAASPASARTVFGSNGCGKSVYQPIEITLTCNTTNARLSDVEWTRWDADSAAGTAVIAHPLLSEPGCEKFPDVDCSVVEYGATVTLSRPVYCADPGRWQFTRLHAEAPEDADRQFRSVRRSYECGEYAKPEPKQPPPRKPNRHRYWHDCGYPDAYNPVTVIVHRVACGKAIRVIRAAWRTGQLGAVTDVSVKGFVCSPRYGGNRLHFCKRGGKVIRGPARSCGSTCEPDNSWSRPGAVAQVSAEAPGEVRVQGEFTFHENFQEEIRGVRMQIWRDGVKVLDRAPIVPCGGCRPIPLPEGTPMKPVNVVQLDATPEPEVVFTLLSPGAHCCAYSVIFRWDEGLQRYLSTTHNFLDSIQVLEDLRHNGIPVFVDTDTRMAYQFSCYICAWYPPQIWEYEDGRLVDATRSFPRQVKRALKMSMGFYRRVAGEYDARGILTTIVAEHCLLGRCDSGFALVRRALHAGHLRVFDRRMEIGPHGRRYVPALRRLLNKLGYV